MPDFDKIDKMIDIIENSEVPKDSTFNQFAIDFYNETLIVPISKYLKNRGKTNKTPKIMNMKKAGEVLLETSKNNDMKIFLSRKGYKEIPELSYKSIMVLRKTPLLENWIKILKFFEGKMTIEEINNSTKKALLPDEKKKVEDYIKSNLSIDEKEYEWFLNKLSITFKNKELLKSLKKLLK